MPIYRPCMANNRAGTKLGAASRGQNPNLKTGVIHGGRSHFVIVACAASMVTVPSRVHAALIWDWSFGDTEAGTFTTDGTLADAAGSFNFPITNFTVTASTVSSLIGSPYSENQPVQGFLWNGVSATEFYRSSGLYTNGSNFSVSDPSTNQYGYLFYADLSGSLAQLADPTETPVVDFSALTLTPVSVPEPSTYAMALAGLACGGYSMWRRRKWA